MKGYAEESEEVKARRTLRLAAESFVGMRLVHPHGGSAEIERAGAWLEHAAIAFAATQEKPTTAKKRKRAT